MTPEKMTQEQFVQTYLPKLGMGLPTTIASIQIVALTELLIRKGVFTREELGAENQIQFRKCADAIDMTPVVSPIQIQRS